MANFIEESKSSEYGPDPEQDSPQVANEEDDFDDSDSDYDNSDWDDEGFEDEGQPESMERPTAPDASEFEDQGTYDEAFETYLGERENFEAQQPGEIERSALDSEVYNNLDRLGMTGNAKPAARESIAAADNFLKKAMQADLRGEKGKAREQRQRAEYTLRTATEENAKDSPAQKQGKKNALKVAEGVIREARFSDAEQYKEKYPMGRGFDTDVRQAIDAFNDNATGDTVYCIREYSTLNENLADTPKGLSDGSQLLQVKIPNHFESAKELVVAARSSSMSVYDYLLQIGQLTINPVKKEKPEPEETESYHGMTNQQYRAARGFKIKPPQLGGAKKAF